MTKHFTAKYTAKSGKSGMMQFSRINISEDETLAESKTAIEKSYANLTISDLKEVVVAGKVLDDQGSVVSSPPLVVGEVKK